MTAKERLIADCKYYGTFNGRWHSNQYWNDLLNRAESMTEQDCIAAIQDYTEEADAAFEQWRMAQ